MGGKGRRRCPIEALEQSDEDKAQIQQGPGPGLDRGAEDYPVQQQYIENRAREPGEEESLLGRSLSQGQEQRQPGSKARGKSEAGGKDKNNNRLLRQARPAFWISL